MRLGWLSAVAFIALALACGGHAAASGVAEAASIDTVASDADSAAASPADTLARPPDRVVVYYFHPEFRCETCLNFEAYAAEALREAFADELASGRIEWCVVDIDRPESSETTMHYAITGSALVVSVVRGGDEVFWTDLSEIWERVGVKREFMDYVQAGVAGHLGRVPRLRRMGAPLTEPEEK